MKKCLPALLIIAWLSALQAQEPFSSVEERMTGQEFTATGLHKLTPEELAALNAWLRKHSVATLDRPAGTSAVATTGAVTAPADGQRAEQDQEAEDAKLIQSRITGEFNGWDGNTVFRLDNGMVWKQDEDDVFRARPAVHNPVVTIKRGMLRGWRLQVEGYDEKVKVERLQ